MKRIQVLAAAVAVSASLLIASTPAQALIEIKAGYGLLNATPKSLNDSVGAANKVDSLGGITADVVASLPVMPIGIGLRYENFQQEKGSSTDGYEADFSRVSVLINKRFIDTLAYVGPLVTVGLTNDFKYKLHSSGVTTELKADAIPTLGAGVEAGVKLGLFMVGGELGYLLAPLGKMKDSSGATATNAATGAEIKADLSGVYMRVLVGVGI